MMKDLSSSATEAKDDTLPHPEVWCKVAVVLLGPALLLMIILFTEELREHFSKYGEIESINVKTDPNTGRSRGFAFIVFSNTEAIDKVRTVLLKLKNC